MSFRNPSPPPEREVQDEAKGVEREAQEGEGGEKGEGGGVLERTRMLLGLVSDILNLADQVPFLLLFLDFALFSFLILMRLFFPFFWGLCSLSCLLFVSCRISLFLLLSSGDYALCA